MFQKPDTVRITPRVVYRMETASPMKTFNGWHKLVGQWTKLLMPEMEGKFICLEYQMWKSTGAETREVFDYLGWFWHGCQLCPIDIIPSATLKKPCWAGTSRLKRGCRKYEIMAIKLFRSRVASLETSCVIILISKMNFAPLCEHSPINNRDALYFVESGHENLHWVKQGEEIHCVNPISLYP